MQCATCMCLRTSYDSKSERLLFVVVVVFSLVFLLLSSRFGSLHQSTTTVHHLRLRTVHSYTCKVSCTPIPPLPLIHPSIYPFSHAFTLMHGFYVINKIIIYDFVLFRSGFFLLPIWLSLSLPLSLWPVCFNGRGTEKECTINEWYGDGIIAGASEFHRTIRTG